MANIAKCPLCDGPGELKSVQGKFRRGWVGCPKCGLYIQWNHAPGDAVRKWNRRQKNEVKPA